MRPGYAVADYSMVCGYPPISLVESGSTRLTTQTIDFDTPWKEALEQSFAAADQARLDQLIERAGVVPTIDDL